VNIDGQVIWALFRATLVGFLALIVPRMSLELMARRFGTVPPQVARQFPSPEPRWRAIQGLGPLGATSQELAESDSEEDEDEDDDGRHHVMPMSDSLPVLRLSLARGIGWRSGHPLHPLPILLALRSQRLIC
jgi:hypothetical protein